jgi:4-amino-4-deoxy-L-arabinose transferase-like glycosyltransferase
MRGEPDMPSARDPELSIDPSGDWPSLASDLESRFARVVTWLAALFIGCVGLWEIASPLVAGHYASTASMGIIADNMRRWDIVAPVWLYTDVPPDPSLYYCHHPWGIFWTTTLIQALFGRSDVTCRIAPAALSVMTVLLLSALGRALWRPLAGAVAAVVFVVLPISLAFAQFNALEVPLMAWSALFLWGWARFRRTKRRRHMAAMLAGATMALHADWPGYVLVGLVLMLDLASLVFGSRKLDRRLGIGWALLASTAVLAGGFYLFMFTRYGAMNDLMASYELRRGAEEISIRELIEARSTWDEWMLTRAFAVLMTAGTIATFVRAWDERRIEALAPTLVLAMAAFQYVVFRQGAWIHVFWPHTFALALALASGALVATAAPWIAKLAVRSPRLAGRGHAVTLLLCMVGALVVLRDGLDLLVWARRTGGRFDERGLPIETDAAAIALLRVLDRELPPDARVGLHESMAPTWAHTWALGGRVVDHEAELPRSRDADQDVVIADLRNLKPGAIERLLRSSTVRLVDQYAVVTPGRGPLTSETLAAREPAFAERIFGAAFEPVRTVQPSPFPAWLVADHFGGSLPSLDREPETIEELAVMHDAALALQGGAGAEPYRLSIGRRLEGPEVPFEHGGRLLGAVVTRGASPRAVLVVAADGPAPEGWGLAARALVVDGPALSLARQPAGATRDLGLKWLVVPSRWKHAYLYTASFDLLPRPGIEAIEVAQTSHGSVRKTSAGEWIEIFRE